MFNIWDTHLKHVHKKIDKSKNKTENNKSKVL